MAVIEQSRHRVAVPAKGENNFGLSGIATGVARTRSIELVAERWTGEHFASGL